METLAADERTEEGKGSQVIGRMRQHLQGCVRESGRGVRKYSAGTPSALILQLQAHLVHAQGVGQGKRIYAHRL